MTNGEFELLVKRFEKEASDNSKLYRLKVRLMTSLGFGYVIFFLALFLLLVGFSISYLVSGHFAFGSIKLLLIAGGLSYLILKAMFIKMDMPEGYYLKKEDASKLITRIEDLRKNLGTPEIHLIVLDSTYNAGVLQFSKFGFFGRKQNILLIGLPLLLTLDEEEFLSVLAHELAHISHSDTDFGAKIYRVRLTWDRLMHSLMENKQFGTFIFRKFFQWYYPRYDAFTFALARQQEYEADMVAMKSTSGKAVNSALCKIAIANRYYYEDFYHELFIECAKTNTVPAPYSEFKSKFTSLNDSLLENYLLDALKLKSSVTDTHPSLQERLQFLHLKGLNPERGNPVALDVLFDYPNQILNAFNEMWAERNHDDWKDDIKSYLKNEKRFEELSTKNSALDLDELWEKANLARQFDSDVGAVKVYEEIICNFADNEIAPAYLYVGIDYLHNNSSENLGISYIEKAMDLDWECRLHGFDSLCEYYHQTKQVEKFEKIRAELEKWVEIVEQSDEECHYFNASDKYVPHDKHSTELEIGIKQLSDHPEIMSGYLVRKVLTVIPERKQYLLALRVRTPQGMKPEEYKTKLYEKYVHELSAFGNASVLILIEEDELLQKIRKLDNSLLYSAEKNKLVF